MDIVEGYIPNEWQSQFHASSARHKCNLGGLGSGKSFCAIQELKQCALESPGSIWVIGRKLLPALRDSVWRDLLSIIPQELIASYNKTNLTLILKNKSEFWGRPLYDPEVFKSYQISGFMIDEANEVDQEIYHRLRDRMRQMLPNGTRPRYQSIVCLNPPDEDHWIPQLFMFKKPPNTAFFQSSTFQNMSNLPEDYVEELRSIYSDAALDRYLYGNLGRIHKGRPVFSQFKIETHAKPVQYNPQLPLIRGWDFGYNHPACVWMQLHGRQIRVLAEAMGKKIFLDRFVEDVVLPTELQLFGRNIQNYLDFCDPHGNDQTDKGATSVKILNEHMIFPRFRRMYIEEGLKAINFHLDTIDAHTKLPNFLIHPRCRLLVEALKGGYHFEEGEERPTKDGHFDHCVAGDALIDTDSGPVLMKEIKRGMRVLTRKGYRRVLAHWSNGIKATRTLRFSNGSQLVCTGNHKVFSNSEWVEADALRYGDRCVSYPEWEKRSGLMGSPTNSGVAKNTGAPMDSRLLLQNCTETFGNSSMDQSQKGFMSTIKTTISTTTRSAILRFSRLANMESIILGFIGQIKRNAQWALNILSQLGLSLSNGTVLRLAGDGTRSTLKEQSLLENHTHFRVRDAASLFRNLVTDKIGSVQTHASPPLDATLAQTMSEENVQSAKEFSRSTGTREPKPAPAFVLSNKENGPLEVFDITVEGEHEFFANGILVHNCVDAMRYGIAMMATQMKMVQMAQAQQNIEVHIDPVTGRRVEIAS